MSKDAPFCRSSRKGLDDTVTFHSLPLPCATCSTAVTSACSRSSTRPAVPEGEDRSCA